MRLASPQHYPVSGATGTNLHEVQRAFDVEVWTDRNSWSLSDIKLLSQLGAIGTELGLVWGGDGRGSDFHFELPPSSATPAPPTNAGTTPAAGRQPLRLEQSVYEFPRDLERYRDSRRLILNIRDESKYWATVRTPAGLVIGSFTIDFMTQGDGDGIEFRGGSFNKEQLDVAVGRPNATSGFYDGAVYRIPIAARDFQADKIATKSLDTGTLRFTISLENPSVTTYNSRLEFNKDLRIRVTVAPLAGIYEPVRPMAPTGVTVN